MIFVLPVSDVDLNLALPLTRHIARLGGVEKDRAVVVSTWRASWDIAPIVETLSRCFGDVRYIRIGDEMEDGWPIACNHLFVRGVEELNPDQEFFFCEADHWPLRRGWFADLKAEYDACGKRYMGVFNTARWFNLRTKEFTGESAPHLVGTAIYPADFLDTCKIINTFDWRQPWDVMIGPEILPDAHNTKLIQHRWNSINWRWENGLLVADRTEKAIGFGAPEIKPVSLEAATLHGVKDLSLDTALNPS